MNVIIKLKSLILSLIPPALTGISAYLAVGGKFELYERLRLPPLSPPPAVFGIVWTVLYFLMGISAYLLHQCGSKRAKKALLFHYISLLPNLLWPIVFFRFEQFTLALVILILLWAAVFAETVYATFCKGRVWVLSVPYLLWLSFAAYLNMGVVCLN